MVQTAEPLADDQRVEIGTLPSRGSLVRFARALIWPTPADIRRDWGVVDSAVMHGVMTLLLGVGAISLLWGGNWYCLLCATGAIWFGHRAYACAIARKW